MESTAQQAPSGYIEAAAVAKSRATPAAVFSLLKITTHGRDGRSLTHLSSSVPGKMSVSVSGQSVPFRLAYPKRESK
jgi:hypothetical protein